MKRKIVQGCFALLTLGIVAAEGLPSSSNVVDVAARAEKQKRFMQARLRKTGGIIRDEKSVKGAFVILNAQKLVASSDVQGVITVLERGFIPIRALFKDDSGVVVATISHRIKAAGGTIGVGLIEDANLPAFVTAPESGWTLVNVTKLSDGCSEPVVLAARVRKEIMRALAFTTGCAYMTKADPLMRDVTKATDLDALPSENFGIEILTHLRESAPLYGIRPWRVSTYLKACEEGWAPAPTNDVQKAIWDKVHAMPTSPIKIKPETKKVTE